MTILFVFRLRDIIMLMPPGNDGAFFYCSLREGNNKIFSAITSDIGILI
jgi:hypothetical protein